MNIDLSHLSVADMAGLAAVVAGWMQLRSVWLKNRKEVNDRVASLEKKETAFEYRCQGLEEDFKRLQKHDDRMFGLLDSINDKLSSISERLASLESRPT